MRDFKQLTSIELTWTSNKLNYIGFSKEFDPVPYNFSVTQFLNHVVERCLKNITNNLRKSNIHPGIDGTGLHL